MTIETHEEIFARLKPLAESLVERVHACSPPHGVIVLLEALLEERRRTQEVLLVEIQQRLASITHTASEATQGEAPL